MEGTREGDHHQQHPSNRARRWPWPCIRVTVWSSAQALAHAVAIWCVRARMRGGGCGRASERACCGYVASKLTMKARPGLSYWSV
jgi:hypothetical protein